MKPIFAVFASTFLLGACAEGTQQSAAPTDPLSNALSGKTIVSENFQASLGSNGSFNGKATNGMIFKGAWTVRDGQFCRTLTEPKPFVGTECQNAELGDGTVTLVTQRGPVVYQIN